MASNQFTFYIPYVFYLFQGWNKTGLIHFL